MFRFCSILFFFFFKQKTAYEMRISDWSSDVCSSDLTLEAALKQADETDKRTILQQLATKWDDVNKAAPVGFIYEELAELDGQFDNWLKAGDAYRAAYANLQDTLTAGAFNDYAINAYEKALALDSTNLDAKVGLCSAYVTDRKSTRLNSSHYC